MILTRPLLHPMAGITASQQNMTQAAPAAGYGWAPTDVAGLLFWLRSDVGVAVSGSEVESVADQSGNGLDTVAEDDLGGGRVTVQNNVTAGFNEIKFTPVAGWSRLRFTASNPFSGVTAAHIFASLKLDNDPAPNIAQSGLWHFNPVTSPASLGGSRYSWHADGHVYDSFGGQTRFDFGDPAADLTAYRSIDVQNQTGAGNFKWFIDGAQLGSGQAGDGSSWASSCWFGLSLETVSHLCSISGTFLDLFMYDSVLTGTDLTNARNYVTARFDGSWTAAGGDG